MFQWLLRRGVQKQDIILYGQSLGSGPTLDLAARERGIGGVVLHAAFASGVPRAYQKTQQSGLHQPSPAWQCMLQGLALTARQLLMFV